jgi:uncharacterized BrkB/YihY/UPF0761 family membrane protein
MNPEPPPIADPHSTAPIEPRPRRLRTILSVWVCGTVGLLLFALSIAAATQVAGIWFDQNPSHDRDITGMMFSSIIALFLCPLGLLLMFRAWRIWKRGEQPPS